jgi:glutamate-ammonia-ligase adenylyltransferase
LLEEQTDEGFLYRVDLKLRPWGRSGPLAMPVEAMEHYYEASTEAWERFAWLRARVIAGAGHLGADLLQRLQPFIFLRSLSVADLDRFLEIKGQMARQRHRRGSWNVKVGEGGIRDIEFFVQMLQLVNGANHPALRTTNTLRAIAALSSVGLLDAVEAAQLRQSYQFLRRLENRLQMFNEQQTHDLPDGRRQREVIARSFGYGEGALERFEEALSVHRAVARGCFDRILPKEVEI